MLPALTSMRLVVFGPTRPLILILQKTPNNKVREEGGGRREEDCRSKVDLIVSYQVNLHNKNDRE